MLTQVAAADLDAAGVADDEGLAAEAHSDVRVTRGGGGGRLHAVPIISFLHCLSVDRWRRLRRKRKRKTSARARTSRCLRALPRRPRRGRKSKEKKKKLPVTIYIYFDKQNL
jgi:hypothetical protein